jgi:hypothetical protein
MNGMGFEKESNRENLNHMKTYGIKWKQKARYQKD